jgi:peptide/nickel transport system permease protein
MLAPAAACISVILATAAGLMAAASGRTLNRMFEFVLDLMGSLPWLFVLIAFRAAMPLDAGPLLITGVTFGLLAALGWAGPARVIRNVTAQIRTQEFVRQAEALGVGRWRLWVVHLLPNLWPVALAQVWVNLPLFILSEANLGLLGLGVSEPIPSLGNQMRELESLSGLTSKPWLLAPVFLLAAVVSLLWLFSHSREEGAS